MPRIRKARRTDLCPCGSGKKYRRCCEWMVRNDRSGRLMVVFVFAVLAGALLVGLVSYGVRDTTPSLEEPRPWSAERPLKR